ncbi:MAG: sugar-binding domain-containing protein [bacterium]
MTTLTSVQILNGDWFITTDPDNRGKEAGWFNTIPTDVKPALVPGVIQQVFPAYHGLVWYYHSFRPDQKASANERVLLRFGLVDYICEVWLNGKTVGGHEGGELPFTLDVTDAIRFEADNMLAIRVLNPAKEPIDGINWANTAHGFKRIEFCCGGAFQSGGIMADVELLVVPSVRVVDVFAKPNLADGTVNVLITVQNDTKAPVKGDLAVAVSPERTGETLISGSCSGMFSPGESEQQITLQVSQPHPWSVDDPYLYGVSIDMTAGDFYHRAKVRCGFRDFRVVDGFFYLNGKRIFLKSAHTANDFPMGQHITDDPELMRREIVNAKATGFNCLRFIGTMPRPDQLDIADEIGLMFYEESFSGMPMEDCPEFQRRFEMGILGMVKRDRNHPCIAAWGLLNECIDNHQFHAAVAILPKLRELDDTRLVFLNSGRWDKQKSITGSVSNPGSMNWDAGWGTERPVGSEEPPSDAPVLAGDIHFYPHVPQNLEDREIIRNLGKDTQPVFLSEYGIGSILDVIQGTRLYEQAGANPDLEDAVLFRNQEEWLRKDWKRLGFEGVYPFVHDFLLESARKHNRQRSLCFDALRSNPKIVGHNLTSTMDSSWTGEGVWTIWRKFKPGVVEVLNDGWAPLRWCLFVDPIHGYLNEKFTVEAVIANEDVLEPGEYPVCFRIFGPTGIAWEKRTTVKIPESKPFAVPVIKEEVILNGPAGAYTFAAELEKGGWAPANRLTFYQTDKNSLPKLGGKVMQWGLSAEAQGWLAKNGVKCVPFIEPKEREVILVGLPEGATAADWQALAKAMARGCSVVFLNGLAFKEGEEETDTWRWLPLENKGRAFKFWDWLYHKECVGKEHPIFEGLQTRGILDWDYYDQVIPVILFDQLDTPDDVAVASWSTGYCSKTGYICGIQLATYNFGQGRFVLNTMQILEYLGEHPAADRLMLNLIKYARSSGPLAELPSDMDARLKAINYV